MGKCVGKSGDYDEDEEEGGDDLFTSVEELLDPTRTRHLPCSVEEVFGVHDEDGITRTRKGEYIPVEELSSEHALLPGTFGSYNELTGDDDCFAGEDDARQDEEDY